MHFHKDPSALQKKELQSAPVVLHPDFTLDQNSKILTLNQGQATIFGQKYTLPALPFKLPATPALNSLQSLYPSEHPNPDSPQICLASYWLCAALSGNVMPSVDISNASRAPAE